MVALATVLTVGMGIVVLSYAARSLRHEPDRKRFLVLAATLVVAVVVMVVAEDLLVLVAAWLASSALAVAVVRTGPNRATSGTRMRRTLLIGDAALVGAVAIVAGETGRTSISAAGDLSGASAVVAGLLVVLAAMTRGATMPFHRWLPDTLGAPTPSSALLHAGVVNGGALVLVRLSDLVSTQVLVAGVAVVAGAASCVLAEAIMLRRPDVKGRLAWSTIAQMSFTLVLCGLGLTTAATVHLFGHGLYKGALFLGSGGAVRAVARHRQPPAPVPGQVPPALAAFATMGAVALAVVLATGVDVDATVALGVALGWITAGTAATAWLRATPSGRLHVLGLAAGAVGLTVFLLATLVLKGLVSPTVPDVDPALPAALLVPLLVCLVGLAVVPAPRLAAWARRAGRPLPPVPVRPSASW